MHRNIALGAALLGIVACQPGVETAEQMQARMDEESQAARQAIEAMASRFSELVAAGEADSVAAHYTNNAVFMPPNEPAVVGRQAIRDKWREWMEMGTWHLTLTTQSVMANGPLAVERGSYSLHFAPGPDAPMPEFSDSGKYLVHWHKVGEHWMLAEDIWNSDVPMP